MSSKPTKRTAPFSMRLDPKLKAALEAEAAEQNRSLTNYVETVLWEAVAGKAKRKDTARPS